MPSSGGGETGARRFLVSASSISRIQAKTGKKSQTDRKKMKISPPTPPPPLGQRNPTTGPEVGTHPGHRHPRLGPRGRSPRAAPPCEPPAPRDNAALPEGRPYPPLPGVVGRHTSCGGGGGGGAPREGPRCPEVPGCFPGALPGWPPPRAGRAGGAARGAPVTPGRRKAALIPR